MAVKVKFNDMIKSMSGTLSKKRLPDGGVRKTIVRKDGSMFETTTYPRKKISIAEQTRRKKFGVICGAFAIAQKELCVASDPDTRKRVYADMGGIYDRMAAHGKEPTAEMVASTYAYVMWL